MVKYRDLIKSMTPRLHHYLGGLLITAFLIGNSAYTFAEETNLTAEVSDFETSEAADASLTAESTEPSQTEMQKKQQEFLKKINDELNLSKTGYRQLLNSIADTKTVWRMFPVKKTV